MARQTISFFGAGRMGARMATRLLSHDFPVVVWSRSPIRTGPLRELGAVMTDTAAQAIIASQVLVVSMPDHVAVQDVLFNPRWAQKLEGRTVVQMSAIGPSQSRALADAARAHGARYVEVCLLGTAHDAEIGALTLLVGAQANHFHELLEVLSALGRPVRVGDVGQAAALKLAYDQLLAHLLGGFSLALALTRAEGVADEVLLETLRVTDVYAPLFDRKLPRLQQRDYDDAGLPLIHLLKGLDLVQDAVAEHRFDAAGLQGLHQLVADTVARGFSASDVSAVYELVLARRAATDDSDTG